MLVVKRPFVLAQLNRQSYGILGIHQHQISCIVGIYPKERQHEQMLIIDAKVKLDLSRCLASGQVQDTIDYVLIAQLCTELAQQKKYFLLETFASDILDECIGRFQAVWAWVCIQKPAAIPSAAYAYVELERFKESIEE